MKKKLNPANNLLNALKFVAQARKKKGSYTNRVCLIQNNWIVASDEILTIGHPIEEDLKATPDIFQFIEALSKINNEFSIIQLDSNFIAVSSNAYRAIVECYCCKELPAPNKPCAIVNNNIKTALLAASGAVEINSKIVYKKAVLLQANTAVGCNGTLLIEYWHGIDLPNGIMIPKNAALAVCKCKYNLTNLGFEFAKNGIPMSITFYFENDAFIKTNLYEDRMPEYKNLFDVKTLQLNKIPEDFFTAIKAVKNFNKNGLIFFKNNTICSDDNSIKETLITTYKVDVETSEMIFQSKNILQGEKYFDKIGFSPENNMILFFGENARGAATGLIIKNETLDEDIPF